MANTNNVFARYAYTSRAKIINDPALDSQYNNQNNNVVFTGGDLDCYINNIRVGNLESITWSISTETVGNYVMGDRNAQLYVQGKRAVVGSLVFSQYTKHALLEGVFDLQHKGPKYIGDLWSEDSAGAYLATGAAGVAPALAVLNPGRVGQSASWIDPGAGGQTGDNRASTTLIKGLSQAAFAAELAAQLRNTARLVGAQKFNFSDQIPPFDLTLVGVTKDGHASTCALFGLTITQETAGFSQNDLGNSVGMAFVALNVSPWREIVNPSASISTSTLA